MQRLDRLDITTSDPAETAGVYRRNFGLDVVETPNAASATIRIGDAEILLRPPMGAESEGMAALWLEAEDLDQIVTSLKQAGIDPAPIRREGPRRILAIDPKLANQVPLFIFDRKP